MNEKRIRAESDRIVDAADTIAAAYHEAGEDRLTMSVPGEVAHYALLSKTRARRFGQFVHELEQRGLAAIVYNGYQYMGDSASEVRQPATLSVKDMELLEGIDALDAPETVTKIWAQTHMKR